MEINKNELQILFNKISSLQKQVAKLMDKPNKPFNYHLLPLKDRVEYIVDGVCRFYDIEREDLKKRSTVMIKRRHYAARLLRDYTPLNQMEIATILGYKNHSNVNINLQRMDEKMSSEPWGDSRMRAVYDSLIEFLALPSKPIRYE